MGKIQQLVAMEHPGKEGMEEGYDGNVLDIQVIWQSSG